MRSRSRPRGAVGERGSATAEFAVALPAVAFVLAICLGSVQATSLQLRLQDAAADAARSAGRGEAADVARQRSLHVLPDATLEFETDGELVCATLHQRLRVAGLIDVEVAARSCALDGGR